MSIRRPHPLLALGGVAAAVALMVVVSFVIGSGLWPPGPASGSSPQPLAPVALAASTSTTTTSGDTLTVVGTGTAYATPDAASVFLGVSATRPNVHDAVAAANQDMSRLLGALHAQGVVDKDIQTVSISISQVDNCCPSVVTGYQSTNQVSVTIHHLANVSGVLMAAVDAVGNDVQLNGVNLFVSNPSAAITTARTSAMADASARAQAWAKLAGHHVGGLISLSEVVSYAPSAPACSGGCGGAGGGGFSVSPGQAGYTVAVTATYELLA